MNLELLKSEEEQKRQFKSLTTCEDVASLLEVPYKKLTYYLYGLKEDKRYFHFQIPKKSGQLRDIYAPVNGLKIIQQKLNRILQFIYDPKPSAMGFILKRNIVLNAKIHSNKRFVLNLDLKDFFPSIHWWRIQGLFMSWPYNFNQDVAKVLAQICCYDKELPQGAPTSPIISNMICSKLDAALQRFSGELRCQYTRYGDDISFSTSLYKFPLQLAKVENSDGSRRITLGEELINIIEVQNTFKINYDKVRLQESRHRQSVTGLITNKFPNVKRKYIRQIRAMLHAWEIYGLRASEDEFHKKFSKCRLPCKNPPSFCDVLKGKIEFLGMVRGKDNPMYYFFMYKYNKLKEISEGVKREPMKTKFDAFISYASEDKKTFALNLANSLVRKGFNIWFDETEIKVGDSIRRKIDEGLTRSVFGIVVFSKAFFLKNWTQRELDGLVALEMHDGRRRILPIWYKIEKEDIIKFSPPLADISALAFPKLNLEQIVEQLSVKLKENK
ncbi:MAG: TIR domain-containing protein [Candidatus Omnitrophica bacterium]|nr:TIR domain-containing protein [Candidatus Omnitrophota bacterium]